MAAGECVWGAYRPPEPRSQGDFRRGAMWLDWFWSYVQTLWKRASQEAVSPVHFWEPIPSAKGDRGRMEEKLLRRL